LHLGIESALGSARVPHRPSEEAHDFRQAACQRESPWSRAWSVSGDVSPVDRGAGCVLARAVRDRATGSTNRAISWTRNLDEVDFSWFSGGVSTPATTVWTAISRQGEKTAIIWAGDEPGDYRYISYREVKHNVARVANVLLSSGCARATGCDLSADCEPQSSPMRCSPCVRIGAVHSVVFAGSPPNRCAGATSRRRLQAVCSPPTRGWLRRSAFPSRRQGGQRGRGVVDGREGAGRRRTDRGRADEAGARPCGWRRRPTTAPYTCPVE